MNKDSIVDYLSCILFKVVGLIIRCLPINLSLFLGRRIGDLLYLFDKRHRAISYTNLKTAFGNKLSQTELLKLTQSFYRNFGQSIIEIFFIPIVDKKYMDKYISFEGLEHVTEAFKNGRGVVMLGIHAGSWELLNVICSNLGFPFSILVRPQQRFPRLDNLLNRYRSNNGCKTIQRQNQTRQLIEVLKNNEAIGLTSDQGGSSGERVSFFGKDASMPTGAVKLALKYDSVILPGYHTRINGPFVKTMFAKPFKVRKTGDTQKDILNNLQELTHVFENFIEENPKDYYWPYKIWKYSLTRKILILNDGKAGHLRQSQALSRIIIDFFFAKGIKAEADTAQVAYRNKFLKAQLFLKVLFSGKYSLQGKTEYFKKALREDSPTDFLKKKYDLVISCGSALSAANLFIASENMAKSLVIMRPAFLNIRRFDLALIPHHDLPKKRKNVLITEAALNLVNEEYLKEESDKLLKAFSPELKVSGLYIGLLIGGDSKKFKLKLSEVKEALRQIKKAAEDLDAGILATTSRRTSLEIEELLKQELKNYARSKVLIIANERNIPGAVGGILGLSQVIITSAESISMISEAASSAKPVLAMDSPGLDSKHRRFLNNLLKGGYINIASPRNIGKELAGLLKSGEKKNILRDDLLVAEALKDLL